MKKINLLLLIGSFFIILDSFAQIINEIKQSEFSLGNFSSLESLKNDVKNVRIVSLGESNHSMGTTFEAKVAMIKYLHDSLGFNTIAFESGMYDCNIANDLFKKNECTLETFYNSIFPVWKCHELDPLYEFIRTSTNSKNPINFIGIDNQFLSNSKTNLVNQYRILEDSIRSYEKNFRLSENFYGILNEEIKYSNYFKKFSPQDTVVFYNGTKTIDSLIDIYHLSSIKYYSFWKKINSNLRTDYVGRFYPVGSLRDSMMAVNLIDYVNQNDSSKIIVWAASYHLMYQPNEIKSTYYSNKKIMGEIIREEFGDEYYFIGFTPYKGRYGAPRGLFSFKIKPSSKNSIEHFINEKITSEYGFISFREKINIEKIISESINYSRILGVKEQEMNIYKICDALFFIKEMQGVKYYKK